MMKKLCQACRRYNKQCWIPVKIKRKPRGKVKKMFKKHNCGSGFRGQIIYLKSRDTRFCTFCGSTIKVIRNGARSKQKKV